MILLQTQRPAEGPYCCLSRTTLPLIELAAELLGVMMVITDMAGEPVTEILNPCPWFSEHSEDPVLLTKCLADWRQLADDPDFETRFCTGPLEFECARAFVRIGPQLVGMLVAGGLAATDEDERALYRLSTEGRARGTGLPPHDRRERVSSRSEPVVRIRHDEHGMNRLLIPGPAPLRRSQRTACECSLRPRTGSAWLSGATPTRWRPTDPPERDRTVTGLSRTPSTPPTSSRRRRGSDCA